MGLNSWSSVQNLNGNLLLKCLQLLSTPTTNQKINESKFFITIKLSQTYFLIFFYYYSFFFLSPQASFTY